MKEVKEVKVEVNEKIKTQVRNLLQQIQFGNIILSNILETLKAEKNLEGNYLFDDDCNLVLKE